MASNSLDITFNPNPVQKGFIESRAAADLFSSRVGEGKSTALVWACLTHTRHNPGARWVMIRDTFENIQKTTMETFFEWFPPGIAGEYHATRKMFTWASGLAEGTVTFVGMDDSADASKLLSWELGGIGIDEPAPAVGSAGVDEMVFDIGMTRLRQPNMDWYPMKLATNNPDETHWTYKKFVTPGTDDYMLWQPNTPENMANLPVGYYERIRASLSHRPDLIRRFVDGEFGFQSVGKAVTPQWSDKLHLAIGLTPLIGQPLYILWDFGHNPTAIITQRTPMGYWNVLDAMVGEGIGASELIGDWLKPLLIERYGRKMSITHIGDPAGEQREQTSIARSPVRLLRQEIGGVWKKGPVKPINRIPALQQVLTRTIGGEAVVKVDRNRAQPVWFALRGGWHYHVARSGVVSSTPAKDMNSHPGDAMSYGAAVLFPLGKVPLGGGSARAQEHGAGYFGNNPSGQWRIGPQPSSPPPHHGALLKGTF